MRQAVLILSLSIAACSHPADPSEDLVPLDVSGTVTVEGQPRQGRVELWDSQGSDTFADDARLDWAPSSPTGEYHLSTRVERAGCGQFGDYYLRAEITGLVHRDTGEPRAWGGAVDVQCGIGQAVDIDIDLPDWLAWPP